MPVNRLVVLFTPILFAPLAGFICLKAERLGVHLDPTTVVGGVVTGATFITGAAIAFLKSHKFLSGWQAWEKRTDDAANGALDESFKRFLEQVAEKTGISLDPDSDVTSNFTELSVGGSTTKPPPVAEPGAFPADAPAE
jgi:hypothetical protein